MSRHVLMDEAMRWEVLDNKVVMDVLERASKKVANTYAGVIERDDLFQDGAVLMATKHQTVTDYLATEGQGEAWLYRWTWSRLTDIARSAAAISNRQLPLSKTEVE